MNVIIWRETEEEQPAKKSDGCKCEFKYLRVRPPQISMPVAKRTLYGSSTARDLVFVADGSRYCLTKWPQISLGRPNMTDCFPGKRENKKKIKKIKMELVGGLTICLCVVQRSSFNALLLGWKRLSDSAK